MPIIKAHNRLVVLAGLLSSCLGVFAADPDFSGTWRLNPDKSEAGRLPEQPDPSLQVEHKGSSVQCSAKRADKDAPVVWSFTTDGKEGASRIGNESRSIVAKWEGDALLINTIVNAPGSSFTVMDRWKLSRDLKRLRVHRQVVRPRGEVEGDLLYERK